MNVIVVYIFPFVGRYAHFGPEYAKRFADSYRQFPPGYPHLLLVICNGSPPTEAARAIFQDIPCIFREGDNIGWDIGAYQCVADEADCDVLVFLGSSSYFRRTGWLARMTEVYLQHGDNLYGAMASNEIRPHIRTIGFWCSPEFMRSYPHNIATHRDRYEFEHGDRSITEWSKHQGLRALMVTWDGIYESHSWHTAPNGFRNGNQSNCLVFDNFTDKFEGK